jgi:acetolactate synthase I/III small subunit
VSSHTLSVLVENKPGVLARVAGLFSRRAFNIESLAVGPTENPSVSRMTIVVDASDQPVEQVSKQLNKLVNVLKIVELQSGAAVEREFLLIKVAADPATRGQVIDLAGVFRAGVVDVTRSTITLEAAGSPSKIAALLEVLEPYGIREVVRSGRIGLLRGSRGISEPSIRTVRPA